MPKLADNGQSELRRKEGRGAIDSKAQRSVMNLEDLLSAEPASPSFAFPYLSRMITALKAARRGDAGLLSLDPRNISFRSDGAVALAFRGQVAAGATQVLSSSKYSSPELLQGDLDSKFVSLSDAYILGFIFYEIFLGRNLFGRQFKDVEREGELGWLTWHADKSRSVQPLRSLLPEFPITLSRQIDGLILKNAEDRFTDLDQIEVEVSSSSQKTIVLSNLSSLAAAKEDSWRTPQREITHVWHRVLASMRGSILRVLRIQSQSGTKSSYARIRTTRNKATKKARA